MSIKDLFNKNYVNKVVSSKSLDKLGLDAESAANVVAARKRAQEFVPPVDFTSASNWAVYGSAAKYYDDSIRRVYNEFPYDGSESEMNEYALSSSYIDKYIFDEKYPRTTGYAIMCADGWGTPVATLRAASGFYGAPATASYEYIHFTGGPHTDRGPGDPLSAAFSGTLNTNNIFDIDKGRGSNLALHPVSGSTVEFWLKKTAFDISNTHKEVIFDIWNGKESTSDGAYGRFTLEMSASGPAEGGQDVFLLTYLSGTTGITRQPIGSSTVTTSSVADDSWNHYAVSLVSSSAEGLVGRLYINGDLDDTTVYGSVGELNEITGALEAQIGALRTTPPGLDAYPTRGWGKLSASLDEFRYWKERRSHEGIGRNWWTQVRGGTNNDDANTSLGVYYKFNEGITTNSDLDSRVLDYSGRITNGSWTGYGTNSRNTGSAIVSASAAGFEYEDPIIYSSHPDVEYLSEALVLSGTTYDVENNAAILNSMPAWMIEEDQSGDLANLTQIIGSYFDKLQLQVKELPKLKNAQYLSASAKQYPFASHLADASGLMATDIFVDANILESVMSRDEDRDFIYKLDDIKNRIYQNIYNNLVYIYKSKGTEKSFRNLIHCYGVGEELIRLNTYGNNITYELKENFKTTTSAKNIVDFSHSERFESTVYQYTASNNPNSVSFISGTAGAGFSDPSLADFIPITLEGEMIFPIPLNLCCGVTGSFRPTFLTSSLYGMHSAIATEPYETTWPTNDYADLRVVAIKEGIDSTTAKFKLTSSVAAIPELTSSYIKDVYDNSKWNFGVRVVRDKYPVGDFVTGSSTSGSSYAADPYTIEFYGVNTELDIVRNEFYLTGSVSSTQDAINLLRSAKRVFAGAHRENFTGSVIDQRSDVKVSSVRYWMDYLPNEAILAHAKDPEVFGPMSASLNAFVTQTALTGTYVPELETLALNWNFYNITGSNASGQFTVSDYSSGSVAKQDRYGWFGNIVGAQHTGRGDKFPANDNNSLSRTYLPRARQALPEVAQSSEMVRILDSDDETFTRDQRPINYFFSIEKSMYQVISDEMIKMFGTIKEFNRLIGDPVNRYRQDYKLMEKVRNLFFENVSNDPDLDKFIDFYKWIDSSLTIFLMQLIPASVNSSDTVRTLVESHVLERNKYWSKFPTIDGIGLDPEGITAPELDDDELFPTAGPCVKSYYNTEGVIFSNASHLNRPVFRLPASGDGLDVSDTGAYTVSTWMTASTAHTGEKTIFAFGSSGAKNQLISILGTGGGYKLRLLADFASNRAQWTSDDAVLTSSEQDVSYHIVLAFDQTGAEPLVYVNGTEAGGSWDTAPSSGTDFAPTTTISTIGGFRDDSSGFSLNGYTFFGAFGEMTLWNKKLSAAEILELRQTAGTALSDSTTFENAGPTNPTTHSAYTNLASWWRFGEGAGDSVSSSGDKIFDQNSDNDAEIAEGYTFATITEFNDTVLDSQGGGTYTGVCSPDYGNQTVHQPYWQKRASREDAPLAIGNAVIDAARETLRQVQYPTREFNRLVKIKTRLGEQRSSPRREVHGGVNYPAGKDRSLVYSATYPHGPVASSGTPLNVLMIEGSQVEQLQNVTSSAPIELRKKFYDYRASFRREDETGTQGVNHSTFTSVMKGTLASPFSLVSSSVITGYNNFIENRFMTGSEVTNLHSDTTTPDNHIPMQGPFTQQHVGGRQDRHININRYSSAYSTTNNIDDYTTRPEGWQLLMGPEYDTTGIRIMGFVGPDYPAASESTYPSTIRQLAVRYRNSRAKRPVNIRNIKHTTSSVNLGNYSKEYEIVNTSGRSINNLYFVSSSGAPLPALYINDLKQTTNPNSLVGIGPSNRGNYFGTNNGNLSDFFQSTTSYSTERSNNKSQIKTVMVNRFSAPGSPEVQSLGYLDIMAKEKSVYNSLAFRNLLVRTSGSGESDTIRVVDQLDERRGLRNLLHLHAGKFGYDPTFGSITSAEYITKPAFQKANRNTRKRIEYAGTQGYSARGATVTGSVYDNGYVNHSIPQSDIQYSWITASYDHARILGHAWNDSFVSSSGEGVKQAIDFLQEGQIAFSGSIAVDFAGMNTLVVDPLNTAENIVSSSTNTYVNTEFNFSLSGSEVLNSLLLHRNGPYGVNTWKQLRGGSTALARALRRKNIIAHVEKTSYKYPLDVVSSSVSARYSNLRNFTESPVVSKFFPIVQAVTANSLSADGQIGSSSVQLASAYGNNLCGFSNIALNNEYNVSERDPQNYDRIKDLYLGNRTNDPNSPVSSFDYLLYRESVYPALINSYSSSIRVRTNYVNTFWRSNREDRNRKDVDRFGGTIPQESMWSMDATSEFLTATITNRVSKHGDPYDKSVNGGPGILQNLYSQIGSTLGGNVDAPCSPYYARRHDIAPQIRSVVGPEGLEIEATGSGFASLQTTIPFQIDTEMFGGQALWEAGTQAKRTPWYNSYDDFASQMKLKGQEYSIIPEFRISDHINTYVKDNAGDFLVDNNKFLQMSGGIEDINGSQEGEDFFKTYTNSDFLKFFEVVRDDHDAVGAPSSLGLRCKGLLKFLPYNGFYPSERTVDLATAFSRSYGRFVNLSTTGSQLDTRLTSSAAAFAAFVHPIYSPGLLYNTIKSGIAVDYPIFTSSMDVTGGYGDLEPRGTGYYLGSGFISGSDGDGRFGLRLPFETLVAPENYIKDIDIVNMETHASAAQNMTASWSGDGSPIYKMMANNFFAEVPSFFLPEQQFTSLVSAPSNLWESAEKDTVYAARIKVRKSYNNVTLRTSSLGYRNPLTPITQWRTDLHESFTMYSRPSAFGPPVGLGTNLDSLGGFNPCFTPPYYYGECWADVFFTAPKSGSFGINDLLSPDNLAVSYLRIGDDWIYSGSATGTPGAAFIDTMLHVDNIEFNSMQLDASFNLFGKAQVKSVTYDPSGNPTQVSDSDPQSVWVLQSKFETPMLNFAKVSVTNPDFGSGSVARGMWHQYGEYPDTPDKGIFFSVSDIPASYISGALGGDPSLTGSLIDLVGLPTEEKRLGETATAKTIREAIVAVPYIERDSQRSFFELPRSDIEAALSGTLGADNSIQQMVSAMQRYVIPPRMDFVKNPHRVDPFAMYIFEFEHTLDRDDLTDIWQGLLPKIGYAFDDESTSFKSGKGAPSNEVQKEVRISHPLLSRQLLSRESFNNDIRWMVFKIKQEASRNYFDKVIKDQISPNNNFDKGRAAQVGREDSSRASQSKYGFNWPYDFFSLVELVNIEAEVEISGSVRGT
tara:strand:+ start:4366 stop:14034 length:9669 start_codon:yes stop_codon:yes gene_type:complete